SEMFTGTYRPPSTREGLDAELSGFMDDALGTAGDVALLYGALAKVLSVGGRPLLRLTPEVVGGLTETAPAVTAANAKEGLTITLEMEEGFNLKEFQRKIVRLRKAIDEGRAISNLPHGFSDAERRVLTRVYRKQLEARINSMFANNPEARANALKR